MTREQIASMIESVDLPFAFDHFTKHETPSSPPYICFLYPGRDDFAADDANYAQITALQIEFYADEPDFTHEEALEAALTAAGLVYEKSGPDYINEEKMYMTTYTTEVLLNYAD